jgi:hypothetical protein
MKKIGKIKINSEKVIKNEDLVNLRGGYDDWHYAACKDSSGNTLCGTTVGDCESSGRSYARLYCNMYCPGYVSIVCV